MTLQAQIENNVRTEYERLSNSVISADAKEKIMDFVSNLKVEKEIGLHREYYYLTRLRKTAEMLKDKFLNPTEQDLKKLVTALSSTPIIINSRKTGRTYSPRTIQDYKHGMKIFYTWMGMKEIVTWIRASNGKSRKAPEDLITVEEIEGISGNCYNQRDRAFFYVLYDSGCRIGELLNMKNKDIDFDQYGAIIKVNGKTGYRQVRIIGKSIPYLREWQNTHPLRNDSDAWFFCGLANNIRGRQLFHSDIYKTLKKASARAGITRRIHPHLFRHTRATLLASKVTEAPLEMQMGWVHGSKMTRTYVHLSARDQDNAILKAYGIEIEEEKLEVVKPLNCPRCNEPNDPKARFCWKCGMSLDRKAIEGLESIEKTVLQSSVVEDPIKDLVRKIDPEYKDRILATILEGVQLDQEKSRKFKDEAEHLKNRKI